MQLLVPVVFIFICLKLTCLDGQKHGNSRLNFFDTDLLRYTVDERKGNVMVSPASIKSTLAMLLEGASGDTAFEIKSALRLSPNKDEYREELNLYLCLLKANTKGVVLQNANAVFVSNRLKLRKEYEIMLRSVYLSDVTRVDFKNPIFAAGYINNWIGNVTRGLIPSVIEFANISPSTDLVLTNALYFKGTWAHAFNSRATRGGCFYTQGACRTVSMMELYRELNYAYVDNLRVHAVELPYESGMFSMIVLVPQDREGEVALVRDLPYMNIAQIVTLLEPTEVMLTLPKFTVDYSEDMIEALRHMRISTLFSNKANLSGIFEGDIPQVNNMFHKVYMEVNEMGTIAAAATSAMVVPLLQGAVQLRVDHPFVFFIRDNRQGVVLFSGKIEEPSIYIDENGLKDQQKDVKSLHYQRSRG